MVLQATLYYSFVRPKESQVTHDKINFEVRHVSTRKPREKVV